MHNPFSLEGKTILVTGASSGIGRATAIACAECGAKVIVTARNQERLSETAEQTQGEMVIADLTKSEDIAALVATMPKLDGVVCCAGAVETTMLKFSDESGMRHLFETNTFSAINLIRELVSNKRLNKEASIVLISSISGVRCGYIGGSIYGATKGALEGFSKALALELAPQRIRVNTVMPGMVETHLLDHGDVDAEQLEADKQRYPLKRYGQPEEIGQAAVYLLSDATKWMTGSSLLIDGGYTLN